MATGVPTGTSLAPAGTTIFAKTPSSCASHSIVALSVSTSAMMSPAAMASPSFFFQEAMFPVVMVGESAGISREVCGGRAEKKRWLLWPFFLWCLRGPRRGLAVGVAVVDAAAAAATEKERKEVGAIVEMEDDDEE